MTTMPLARIHGPGDIRLDSVPRPEAGPRDILLRVERCGICGSDLSYAKIGGLPGAASPFAIGHEFSGVVVEAGAEVSHVAVGDRVVVNPEGGQNRIGTDGLTGSFAPCLLFRDAAGDPDAVIRLPESLDFELGALVEPLSVGLHAVEQGRVSPGDRVVVFGAGPVGLATALAADYLGAADVAVTDLSERRLAVAGELGLATFRTDSGDIADFLKQRHGTVNLDPLLGEQAATDVLVEATGVGAVFQQILGLARKNARVVVVGVHFAPVELDMINFLLRELHIVASLAYDNGVFARVIDMLASGRVDARRMISHRFPLSHFDEAFAQATQPQEAVKVMVDCQN